MHELAIADAIVGIVSRHANGRPVMRVELKVGHLRQVVPSALEFAWELVAEGTEAEGAELVMEEVPATVRCRACGMDSTATAFPLHCEACGGFDVEVTAGEELLVDSLEIEEEALIGSGGRS
jgi:hydrogenase nickel incorporation protein HypA/HybF